MIKKNVTYIIWLLGVILWNFLYPQADPIYDVIMAMILSGMVTILNQLDLF